MCVSRQAMLASLVVVGVSTLAFADRILVDFGPSNDDDGRATQSPDVNGNYWNSWRPLPGNTPIGNGETLSGVVNASGDATSVSLVMTNSFDSNGIVNGGLLSPDPALLGDFAIDTATEDYWFESVGGAAVRVSGLKQGETYTLRMFGTRENTQTRTTRYTATDANGDHVVDLQTSGAGIGTGGYDGNNDTIVELTGLVPDAGGSISLDVAILEGGFAYLNILEVSGEFNKPYQSNVDRWVEQDGLDAPSDDPIVFIGSSSIRRWEPLQQDFADYNVLQRGLGGALFDDLNAQLDSIVLPYDPRAVVIWAGTNDLASGSDGDEVIADYQRFVDRVLGANPGVDIFYLGIMPTPGREGNRPREDVANAGIAAIAEGNPRLHYIDLPAEFEQFDPYNSPAFTGLFVDSIHLNRDGYAFWTSVIRPEIEAVVSPNRVYTPNPLTPRVGDKVLFDFGPSNPEDGDHTVSPDVRGNHWNNWFENEGQVRVLAGEHKAHLVDTTGADTGLRVTLTADFDTNGKLNGGLFTPDAALLGDLAVATATEDYFFSTADGVQGGSDDDTGGGFVLSGLDPAKTYRLRLFGSRNTTDTRVTEYKLIGDQEYVQNLQTSGNNIGADGSYDGNDDETAVFVDVVPDAFGQIFVDLTVTQGGFAYLNAMELTVTGDACLPDLDASGSLDIDDVLMFLSAFASGGAVADFAEPLGTFNIDDVLAFLGAFAAGC